MIADPVAEATRRLARKLETYYAPRPGVTAALLGVPEAELDSAVVQIFERPSSLWQRERESNERMALRLAYLR